MLDFRFDELKSLIVLMLTSGNVGISPLIRSNRDEPVTAATVGLAVDPINFRTGKSSGNGLWRQSTSIDA